MATSKSPTSVWIARYKGKRGTTYTLRWIDPRSGKWQREAAGRDLAYARVRRDAIREELRNGLAGRLPDVTVADLADRLDTLMAGKSAETITKTQESLRALDRLCNVGLIASIDRATIMDFRAKRLADELAPATVNKDLRQIRSALSYAVDAGLLKANPLLRWKSFLLREPEKRVRVIEEAEFAKLLARCEYPAFKGLLIVAYRQGLRRGELIQLRWSAVDLERGLLHVLNVPEEGEFTKSRKNRSLPLHPQAREALQALWANVPKKVDSGAVAAAHPFVFCWPDGQPFKAGWVSRQFTALVGKAKIAPCSLHDCRRSFSTLAQRAGVDRHTVKDLGGWSTVGVVEKHYTGEIPEAFRQAMDRMAKTAS